MNQDQELTLDANSLSRLRLRMRRSAAALSILSLSAALSGCSFEGASAEEGALASEADSLRLEQGSGSYDFRHGRPLETSGWTPTIDPVICSGEDEAMMVVIRDDANRYRVSQMMRRYGISPWGVYGTNVGTNKTFNSKPSCVMREQAGGGRGFVLVGRGSNDQLFSSAGVILPPLNFVSQTPIAETSWEAIGNTTNVQGGGAMALNNTKIALAFNTTDNRLYIRTRNLPYSQNTWQQKISAPLPPAGATLVGTPAITYIYASVNLFQIVARMLKNGTHLLYETYFNGTSFVSSSGGSASWTMLNIGWPVDSDPALEYTSQLDGSTLYFRSGNRLVQTSGIPPTLPLGFLPERAIDPSGSPTIVGGPGVLGQFQLEFGRHQVIARASDGLYHFESGPDAELSL